MSPDGKPIQVNASALQAAAAQNAVGRLFIPKSYRWKIARIVINVKSFSTINGFRGDIVYSRKINFPFCWKYEVIDGNRLILSTRWYFDIR